MIFAKLETISPARIIESLPRSGSVVLVMLLHDSEMEELSLPATDGGLAHKEDAPSGYKGGVDGELYMPFAQIRGGSTMLGLLTASSWREGVVDALSGEGVLLHTA